MQVYVEKEARVGVLVRAGGRIYGGRRGGNGRCRFPSYNLGNRFKFISLGRRGLDWRLKIKTVLLIYLCKVKYADN